MSVTEEQIARFQADGFWIYGPILTAEELATLQERIDALAAGEGPAAEKVGIRLEAAAQRGGLQEVARRDQVWQIMGATRHDAAIRRHAENPRILAIVAALLGTEDIKLFSDQTLMKPAFHGSPVSWHQDSGYWTSIDPPALVTCWTALDPATEENGCVRMIPGSHKHGVLPHERRDDSFLHAQGIDLATAVPVVLPAGGCSFHHSCTVHGSGPNQTPQRRRGLAVTYMRADSRWRGDPAQQPAYPLLRGREHPGGV
jgi:ectoine hydroxylase-related dioxygenase (phytanoyl-CoA dioxygenase family)